MSIVTDALNRLQSARAHVAGPTAAHDPKPAKSENPKLQDEAETAETIEDEKEPSYDTRFLSISIGGFLIVAAMAMGAYWWGESFVSDLPIVVEQTSARANITPEDPIDQDIELTSSDQKVAQAALDSNDLPPEEQSVAQPDVEHRKDIMPSESLKEKRGAPSIGASHKDAKEPVQEKQSQMQKVASLTEKPASVSNPINDQQVVKVVAPAISINDRGVTKKKTVSSPSSDTSEKHMPNHGAPSSLDESTEPSRSDFSLGIPSDEVEKQGRVKELASLSTKQEPTSRVTKGKKKVGTGSVVKSKNAHAKSLRSLPGVDVSRALPSKNIAPPVSKVQSRLSPQQRLVKAQLLIQRQSHAQAIEVLQPLFSTPPTSWEPWFWMGTAQFGNGDLDKAEDALMEGLVRDDTVPHLWVQRAVIAQQRGDYRKAMDALRQAELLDPDLPEVQLNLGYNFEHQSNPRLARRHYREFLSLTEGKSTYHAVRRKVLERVLRMGNS